MTVHSVRAQWRRLLDGFRAYGALDEAAERFLADSSDLADLERRLRALEYNGMRVMPVTFNH